MGVTSENDFVYSVHDVFRMKNGDRLIVLKKPADGDPFVPVSRYYTEYDMIYDTKIGLSVLKTCEYRGNGKEYFFR